MRSPRLLLSLRHTLAMAVFLGSVAGCGVAGSGGGSDTSTTSSGGGGASSTGGVTAAGGSSTGGVTATGGSSTGGGAASGGGGTGGTGAATTGGTGGAGGAPECIVDIDCPAPATPCQVAACDAGVCGTSSAPAETPCANGGVVCDGAGTCVECLSAGDCPPPEVCSPANKCVVAPLGQACNTAVGLPSAQCNGLYCVDGVCCDSQCLGACRKCNLPGSAGVCSPFANGWDAWPENSFLGCGMSNSCPSSCDTCGPNATCIHETGDPCGQDDQCVSGHCADGRCCDSACADPCKSCNLFFQEGSCLTVPDFTDPKGACGAGATCYGGACKKQLGTACIQGAECMVNVCADGVCCTDSCIGLCRRCAAGSGFCGFVPAGQDPDNECPGAQTCNGSGGCQ